MNTKQTLIGHLNRDYGYIGFKPIKKGHPVYEFKDRYFIEIEPLLDNSKIRQKFYKEDLSKHIDFI